MSRASVGKLLTALQCIADSDTNDDAGALREIAAEALESWASHAATQEDL